MGFLGEGMKKIRTDGQSNEREILKGEYGCLRTPQNGKSLARSERQDLE